VKKRTKELEGNLMTLNRMEKRGDEELDRLGGRRKRVSKREFWGGATEE